MSGRVQPDPKYGENTIKDKIEFINDRHNPAFGRPYYLSKDHEVRERNHFLYKLTHDLNTDSIDVASQSQSAYSALSYQSNFDNYYNPMPPSFEDVNKELVVEKPKSVPPKQYGFVKHNPPFEQRRQYARDCASVLLRANNRLRPGDIKLSESQKVSAKKQPPYQTVTNIEKGMTMKTVKF